MSLDVAIVGFSGRFPGARDAGEFWENLRRGVESIRFFTHEEMVAAGVDEALARDPRYVGAHGELDQVDRFDAGLFGFNPREAEIADPQQRIFLECCWEALEHAGLDPERFAGDVGVYAGVALSSYLLRLFEHRDRLEGVSAFQAANVNDKDALATRVSYKLNLRGPAVGVQTACSTSLVAVHLACQGLLAGDCDAALAGGVALRLPEHTGYVCQEGGILSPDGHCRAFDAEARGTVGGNGCGVVVLKRLEDALAEGDTVHAVIRGSAINNDGSKKVGYTAPGIEGQVQVIGRALAAAELEPDSLGYVEAHGTGTALGDPIEVSALAQAFRAAGSRDRGFCALGSVKTNIGHLDAAAGVAGLIKAVLAVEHGEIPASLHFREPNPKIDFVSSPFFVSSELRRWEGTPRRAGVSSFGIGGTNAHVILEQAAEPEPGSPGRSCELLTVSARSEAVVEQSAARLAAYLAASEAPLADVSYTLTTGRRAFETRRAVLARERGEIRSWDGVAGQGRVAFVFPGQGSQYPGMGRELAEREPAFRAVLAECAEGLGRALETDLDQTRWTQPALFAVEYALARLWESWGVKPVGMLGHSVGEYVAAVLGGLFELKDALWLVSERGRLMQDAEPGAMAAVGLSAEEAEASGLEVAVDNGPAGCVVGGGEAEIANLISRLEVSGVWCRRLKTSHAFHTKSMEAAAERFRERVERVKRSRPHRPWISNVTGRLIDPEEARTAEYWSRQLRGRVRFGEGLGELLASGVDAVLEVGPGRGLSALVKRQGVEAVPGLDAGGEQESVLSALGRLWVRGAEVDWQGYWSGQRRRKVPLPTYPFERQRYWIDFSPPVPQAGLYEPVWRQGEPLAGQRPVSGEPWLIVSDDEGIGGALAARLRDRGTTVTLARDGDWEAALRSSGAREVVHLHTATCGRELPLDEALQRGFHSLVRLGQALGRGAASGPLRLQVVTAGLEAVEDGELVCAALGTLVGPVRVLGQEHPGMEARLIDLAGFGDELLSNLEAELLDGHESWVACRGPRRWVRSWERLTDQDQPERLRERGVYLITGGLGALGLRVAEDLARRVRARLVLTGRRVRTDGEVGERLRGIEALGGEVLVCEADVADREALGRALTTARERFGALHGLFHAAGIAGVDALCPIDGLDESRTTELLRAKVQGTLTLASLLDGEDLDVCVLFSSLSTVLGGVGYCAYAAANGFLDAFATARRSPWISIGWDAWELDAPFDSRRPALREAEGLDLLHRVLASGRPHVLAVAGDLESRKAPQRAPQTRKARPAGIRPPLGSVAAEIASVWSSVLGVADIGLEDNFFDLGGDSLAALQMVAALKRRLRVDLPLRSVLEAPTVARLAGLVGERGPRPPVSPSGTIGGGLVSPLRGGDGPALVCIHPAGGAVFGYRTLARNLGCAVYGVRSLGIEAGEPLLGTIEEMAERYVAEITPLMSRGPVALAGSSLGGVVAFEMGQRMHRAGSPPLLVAMFDTPGPRAWPCRFADDAEALVILLGDDLPLEVETLRGLASDEQLDFVIRQLAARNIQLPLALGLAEARRFLRLFQENSEAMWRYVPALYPGRVTYFRAAEEVDRGNGSPEADWAGLAKGGLELHVIPGGHRSMLDEPHVAVLARRLERSMEQAMRLAAEGVRA
ncbi:MAG TPA: SDR family NAD(P)-dependent oxidoreductase [Thermoanaerobaculia bacterium]|jgi:acyl transferase domain-containing protein/thioesterase domain-containing protein/acyl carrier protein|nr:SDR family NAD(P)-dependent oxidoreductase [Thermoanaerobaculia bacterium]